MQPTHIGRYEVVRVLGQGAMGVVYEAIDPRLARRVAIKTIRVENIDSHQVMAYESRFETEARAVARLAHPNIVSVYDSGQMDGQSYLVLEFVSGVNLKQCLRAGVRFTPRGAVALVQGVLAGLAQAHGQRIIHRDIKPENVLLDAAGQVKLTDFGIAKMLDAEVDNGTQLSGGSIGTPRYMSPEQVRGLPLDARSDVFSAAVLLYELLTGTLPFDGGSAIAIATAILHEEPPSASSLAPGIPPELDAVLAQALSKSVHLRPDSAQALSDAIAAVEWPAPDVAASAHTDAGLPPAWADLLMPDSAVPLSVLFGEVGLALAEHSPSSGLPLGTQPQHLMGTQPSASVVDDQTQLHAREAVDVHVTAEQTVHPSKTGTAAPGAVGGTGQTAVASALHTPRQNLVPLWVGLAVLLAVVAWWFSRPSSPVEPAVAPVAVPAAAATDTAQSLADNEKLVPGSKEQAVQPASASPAASAAAPAAAVKPVDATGPVKPKPAPAADKPATPPNSVTQPAPTVAAKPTESPPASAPVVSPASQAASGGAPGSPEPCPGMGFFEREACLWKQCSTVAFRQHAACARFQN